MLLANVFDPFEDGLLKKKNLKGDLAEKMGLRGGVGGLVQKIRLRETKWAARGFN